MSDSEGRRGDELAPSRDPDARRPMPRVEQGAGDERREREARGTEFEPFLDNAVQNVDHPSRAAGPLPAGETVSAAGQDATSETMLEESGLAPRGGGSPDDTAEGA